MDGELEPDDDEDEEEEEEEEDEDVDEYEEEEDEDEYNDLIAVQQQCAEAINGIEDIDDIQRKMNEAIKAGDIAEYMRLATELQMKIINGMNN